MPYIGQDLQVAFPSYTNIDDISGSFDGVTTSFPLTVGGVAPVPAPLGSNQCLISVDGVVQRPDDTGTEGFRLSGGNIIFSSAPSIADDFFGIILAGADYVNVGANFPDGTLGAPSITFDQDNDTGYYRSGSGAVSFASNGVAAGTWSSAGVTAPALIPTGSSVPANGVYLPAANTVGVATNGTGRLFVNSSGQVGIGVTSPGATLEVNGTVICGRTDGSAYIINRGGYSSSTVYSFWGNDTTGISNPAAGQLGFLAAGSERARIDSSGKLLIGTSTDRFSTKILVESTDGTSGITTARASNDSSPPYSFFIKSRGATVGSNTVVQSGDALGFIGFYGTDGTAPVSGASIAASVDGTPGANDMPGRLVFSTTADGDSSPTERIRIASTGAFLFGKTTDVATENGAIIGELGQSFSVASQGFQGNGFHRNGNDGGIIGFFQDGTQEGSISVSGGTVSYNGAHLSRWSQLASGAERIEILRGSVLSNLDEMCEWGEEENEQLNRMKVSDVEGDKNVSGVFQAWDDDDDTHTNDFYCAMTGDFIIRIAADTTVERGDLLMSTGDGTAKPQDDDIIRSKTIAKVTSTNVSCTYPDGSYCVPCVLMAC